MLTEHQDEICNKAIDLLLKNPEVLISGSAGVGKTYMVEEFIKTFPRKKGKVMCSAPTHKALAVLMSKISVKDVVFSTIHSALQYKMSYGNGGEKVFKPKPHQDYPPLKNISLLVIDEASMIGEDMLKYIREYAGNAGTKVVYIGDSKQINPVKEEESSVFVSNIPEVTLTEIIRQGKGSPIIDLSRDLSLIHTRINNFTDDKGYVFTSNLPKIIMELASENGTDNIKYLSYSNKDVDMMNKRVREAIYGKPMKVELGESIVFNSPYKNTYHTNSELKVRDIEVLEKTFTVTTITSSYVVEEDKDKKVKLKVYLINKDEDMPVYVIHEDSETEFKKLKTELRANAKRNILSWKKMNEFLDTFADFKYNHALTVHKSQGSTFKTAIINSKNIMFNRNLKERKRLLYTAVTRASDLVVLL